jgi:hypothetical protein
MKSGTRTATGTTDSYTFPLGTGKILRVNIVNSASTDYKVYTLQGDGTTADEYILGGASTTVTVATASKFYPGVALCGTDGASLALSAVPFVLGWKQIKVDASNLSVSDTWSIDITYEI